VGVGGDLREVDGRGPARAAAGAVPAHRGDLPREQSNRNGGSASRLRHEFPDLRSLPAGQAACGAGPASPDPGRARL